MDKGRMCLVMNDKDIGLIIEKKILQQSSETYENLTNYLKDKIFIGVYISLSKEVSDYGG